MILRREPELPEAAPDRIHRRRMVGEVAVEHNPDLLRRAIEQVLLRPADLMRAFISEIPMVSTSVFCFFAGWSAMVRRQ